MASVVRHGESPVRSAARAAARGWRLKPDGAIMALALASCPSAVVARSEQWRDASAVQSRRVGVAYARCAVQHDRRAVEAYLAKPVGTDDAGKVAAALPSACLSQASGAIMDGPGELRSSTLLMRGLLFEVLYALDHGKRRTVAALRGSPQQTYPVVGVDAPGQTIRRDYRALMRIGDCAVRTAPAEVQALLASTPASKAEGRAAAALASAWAPCLPGRGDATFSTEMMRATVVEPLYRMVRAMNNQVDG